MRALIGLIALAPVAILVGVLLRTRIQARMRARDTHQAEINRLIEDRQEIEEARTVERLQRELDVARAREEKRKS